MITIADKKDLTEILELQYAAFRTVAVQMGSDDLPPFRDKIEDLEKEYGEGLFLKYVAHGKIAGSIRGKILSDGNCYIGKLIVDPQFQRIGLGKELMLEIEKYFPSCPRFTLFTAAATPHTYCMYRKLGYEEKYRKTVEGIPMIFMEKINRGVPRGNYR